MTLRKIALIAGTANAIAVKKPCSGNNCGNKSQKASVAVEVKSQNLRGARNFVANAEGQNIKEPPAAASANEAEKSTDTAVDETAGTTNAVDKGAKTADTAAKDADTTAPAAEPADTTALAAEAADTTAPAAKAADITAPAAKAADTTAPAAGAASETPDSAAPAVEASGTANKAADTATAGKTASEAGGVSGTVSNNFPGHIMSTASEALSNLANGGLLSQARDMASSAVGNIMSRMG